MLQVSENMIKNDKSSPYSATLSQFMEELAPVAGELAALPETLDILLPKRSSTSKKVARHILEGGGKRVRPALFFLACRLTGYKGEHLQKVAAVCEYVHTASLLHDDVVDESRLRRGRATPNAVWGNQPAVLVGDLVYATACELMASTGKVELVEYFARAIRLMSEGELIQLENKFNVGIERSTYMNILSYKTGALIGTSCAASAILADSPPEAVNALYEFGNNIGIAFQLIDDALDYDAKPGSTGKASLKDLEEGKLTLPLIVSRDLASESDKIKLADFFHSKQVEQPFKDFVSELIERHQGQKSTLELAQTYTDSAVQILHAHFPESNERSRIEKIARMLLARLT